MADTRNKPSPPPESPRHFATTQWSLVVAAGDLDRQRSRAALTELCECYWYPVYAYVRRRFDDLHTAQDLTQAFFSHLLEKQLIHRADRNRGRFRAFLLTSLQNFLMNEWDKAHAGKRGGTRPAMSLDFDFGESRLRIEPAHNLTAERLFERRWVIALLDQVLDRLRAELAETGRADYFEQFKNALTGESSAEDYARAARLLQITEAAAKQTAYRLRKRYRELFRAEVARTLAADEDVDEEIGRLLAILAY